MAPLNSTRFSSKPRSSSTHLCELPAPTALPITVVPGVGEDNLLHACKPALMKTYDYCRPQSCRILDEPSIKSSCNTTLVCTDNIYTISEEVIIEIDSETWNKAQGWFDTYRHCTQSTHDLYPGAAPTLDRPARALSDEPIDVDTSSRSSSSRSLTTSPSFDTLTMATTLSTPGSPPELSDSRWSKASSYASDTSSSDSFSHNIMNFEDISLGEVKEEAGADYRQSSITPVRKHDNKENTSMYQVSPKRPSLSTIQTQPRKHLGTLENGIKSATTPAGKRGFTSPALSHSQSLRNRSASPLNRTQTSLQSARDPRSALSPATALSMQPRRGSWQPTRKSVSQLEAECNDSDDELPDDASLFNVPISPHVTRSRSAVSSAKGSPERDSPAHSPAPLPLDHARTLPDIPQKRTKHSRSVPRHRLPPRTSSQNLSKSNPASPQMSMYRNQRARSWNSALYQLSDETRNINEKLEQHYEQSDLIKPALHRSSAPGAIPLPPIQTGTLDFMPMSKEKEAILSRTRPSWLPPKDPKEEKKHLKQYQEMMRAALEADKKREAKLKEQKVTQENTRDSLIRVWTYFIDPTTDISTIDTRVDGLCWRGIPGNLRGRVWQRKVGNSLGLTSQSYNKALARAQEIKATPPEQLSDHEKKMLSWFRDIERDAETAFPECRVFSREGQHWQDLVNVCEAYACYRSDVGYYYGLQLVAALIMLQLPSASEVFVLLANCLNRGLAQNLQIEDIGATKRTFAKVKSTLDIKYPRLYTYLFGPRQDGNLAFDGEELFGPMFRTLLANGLDADRASRVWDIWIFEGDRHLIRAAVALLGSVQQQIFDVQGDIDLRRRNIQEMLGWGPFNRDAQGYWDLTSLGDPNAFVEQIRAAGKLDYAGN